VAAPIRPPRQRSRNNVNFSPLFIVIPRARAVSRSRLSALQWQPLRALSSNPGTLRRVHRRVYITGAWRG